MGLDRFGLTLLLLAGLCGAARAAGSSVSIDSETVRVLGWNGDCSVAVSHFGFAPLGDAILGDPVMTRIGTLTIAPGSEKATEDWAAKADGVGTWSRAAAAQAEKQLRRDGYVRLAWSEEVRPETSSDDEDGRVLLSTDAFQSRSTDFPAGYPASWRLARVDYAPQTAACALLTFQASSGRRLYRLSLIRVGSVVARKTRARAHLGEAWRLLDRGDRGEALAETAIAAGLCPEDALSRYRHSLQLLLDGQTQASLDELAATVKLDPSFKKRARADKDFRDIDWMPRFKELTR